MDITRRYTVSRKLHSRAIFFVLLWVCLLGFDVWADPVQGTKEITVKIGTFVSIMIQNEDGPGVPVTEIPLGEIPWNLETGQFDVSKLANNKMEIVVLASSKVTVTIPGTVELYLDLGGGVKGPQAPDKVEIAVAKTDITGGTVNSFKQEGGSWVFEATPFVPGYRINEALGIEMKLNSWSLNTLPGTYRGTLRVTAAI